MGRTPAGDPLRARIVAVLGNLDLGGAERQAILLARHLSAGHGADVSVLGLAGDPGGAARLCDAHGLRWRSCGVGWPAGRAGRLRAVARFARELSRERPDAVLSYTRLPNILCGLAWRLSGAGTCVWNQRDAGLGAEGERLFRLAARLVPRFLANSEEGRAFLVARCGVPPERVRVVPNGVGLPPPREGRDAWRRRLGIPDGAPVAVMLASVHPHKDHATLLSAWRAVLARHPAGGPPPVLLLAGRSYGFDEGLKVLAFDLGLGRSVRFLGEVEDVSGLLSASDLCVHSTRTEGLPNAVLEAMAAGLPVAATDIPGTRAALGEEGAGFLAPPGDPDALAARILALLASERLRAETGSRLKERAALRFDPGGACRAAAEALREALAEGRR